MVPYTKEQAVAYFEQKLLATTFVQSTQQLALWYKGPFDSRPNDSIGFGIANLHINRVSDLGRYSSVVVVH
jgi:carbohydrate-selective porin OprB